MNIQVIQEENTDKIYIVEINQRFPTSLPLTVAAGINIPEILIDNFFNEKDYRLTFT